MTSSDVTKPPILQTAPILTLPHELLVHILSHNLARPQAIVLRSGTRRRWQNEVYDLGNVQWKHNSSLFPTHVQAELRARRKAIKSPLLELLLVSRQFYFAGIAAFFGENVLKFEDLQHLAQLNKTLDLDRRRCIRSIELHFKFHQGLIWGLEGLPTREKIIEE